MFSISKSKTQAILKPLQAGFMGFRSSTLAFKPENQQMSDAQKHTTSHKFEFMNPKYYENDFVHTAINEIEYVRSPFYDLAKHEQMKEGADTSEFLSDMMLKTEMISPLTQIFKTESPTKRSVAFTRYADEVRDESIREKLQFPMGKPFKIIDPSKELFKVQRPDNHWENVSRSKEFLAKDFFPPRMVPLDENLQRVFNESSINDEEMVAQLFDIIPNLNHDQVVNLALYLAFSDYSFANDKSLWRQLESASYTSLHLFSLKQLCQLFWACTQLKPKQVTTRFSTMVEATMLQNIDRANALELAYIMQGFRQKNSKVIYRKVRQLLIDKKSELFPQTNANTDEARDMLVNLFFTVASSMPRSFGVYRTYAEEELNELIAHYEHDLCDAAENGNAEQITRLAQALYIFKTDEFENILQRIERRSHQLASEKKLDVYHVTNILRAFSRSQKNRMNGLKKTYYTLEPIVLANIDSIPDRDLTHLMYAYAVRAVGNPELHKAFEKKLEQIAGRLDYPGLFNAIYYLLFRGIKNELIWHQIVTNTINQNEILPLIYYRPFKVSKFFLTEHFPQWKDSLIEDYVDKFYHSEKYFNVIKLEDNFESDPAYMEFKAFLQGHLFVYPTTFCTQHNLFTLHFVFNDFKIAINLHLRKFCKREDNLPSEMLTMASKILHTEGWEIWELPQEEFESWDFDERKQKVSDWLKAAKERQIEKGIVPKEQPKYV